MCQVRMLFSDFGLFSLPLRLSEAELSACAKVVLPEEAEHLGKLSFAQAAALRVEAAALCSRGCILYPYLTVALLGAVLRAAHSDCLADLLAASLRRAAARYRRALRRLLRATPPPAPPQDRRHGSESLPGRDADLRTARHLRDQTLQGRRGVACAARARAATRPSLHPLLPLPQRGGGGATPRRRGRGRHHAPLARELGAPHAGTLHAACTLHVHVRVHCMHTLHAHCMHSS